MPKRNKVAELLKATDTDIALAERAYQLHASGLSYLEIAKREGIDTGEAHRRVTKHLSLATAHRMARQRADVIQVEIDRQTDILKEERGKARRLFDTDPQASTAANKLASQVAARITALHDFGPVLKVELDVKRQHDEFTEAFAADVLNAMLTVLRRYHPSVTAASIAQEVFAEIRRARKADGETEPVEVTIDADGDPTIPGGDR